MVDPGPRPRPAGVPTVLDAERLAAWAHHGQTDRQGMSYIAHPAAVAAAVAGHGPLTQMAGWLHDTVEDSNGRVTLATLAEDRYPPEVVAAVDALTRRLGETYLDAVRRAAADPMARVVKEADVRHNRSRLRGLARTDPVTATRLRRKYAQALPLLVEG